MSSPVKARPQVTAHIDAETRRWLDRYARSLKLKPSELVRLLIVRERRVRLLETCMTAPRRSAQKGLTSIKDHATAAQAAIEPRPRLARVPSAIPLLMVQKSVDNAPPQE